MPNLERARVRENQRTPRETIRRGHLDDGQVGLRVRRHEFGLGPGAIIEDNSDLLCARDHVVVGYNVAFIVKNPAGTLTLRNQLLALVAGQIRQLRLLILGQPRDLEIGRGGNAGHFNAHHRGCNRVVKLRQRLLPIHLRGRGSGHIRQ